MASHPRRTTRVEADGVRRVETRGVRVVLRVFAVVVALVSLGIVVAVVAIRLAPAGRREEARSAASPPAPRAETRTDAPTVASPAPEAAKVIPRRKPDREAAAKPPPDEDPEAPFTVLEPGERRGMAVFPPPGTKPIKRGIVVPDDFELPPGYVRHHQTTDDGEQLPAILMFHPDFEYVDAHGAVVPVPESRIVPPEMAPPGLPIQMLEVRDPKAAPGAAP
jgi:hypothetical protein